MTADGFYILVDAGSFNAIQPPKKIHNMPISAVTFAGNKLITVSTDYHYNILSLSSSFGKILCDFLKQIVLFLILSFFLIDYLISIE